MNFWEWLHKAGPGWPTERQWVSAAIIGTLWIMLQMAVNNPGLWEVKLFELILQAIALTGLLNMIVAFHFSANTGDETRAENTGKLFDAITASQSTSSTEAAADAAQEVADAAVAEASAMKGDAR